MALPETGALSLSQIANEFGGSAPLALGAYRGASTALPAQGPLAMSLFRGLSSAFAVAIISSQKELNLHSYLLGQGWDGQSAVAVTVNAGVYIWSDNSAVAALNTGGLFSGGLTLINNGFIMGKGGAGGLGNQNGSPGGPAIRLTTALKIDNTNGYIGGGGGGGAGSGSLASCSGGGGAGGGIGRGFTFYSEPASLTVADAPGGAIGQPGTQNITIDPNFTTSTIHVAQHGGAGGAGGVTTNHSTSTGGGGI
jgi:hypothetical protein